MQPDTAARECQHLLLLPVQSYTVYVALTYVALGLVLLLMGLFGWMAFAIKNDEQERRKYRK